MNNMKLTEDDCIAFLVDKAKAHGDSSPRCIVVNRVVKGDPRRTLQRTVRFALVVSINNETLLNAIMKDCLDSDFDVAFVGSDVNLQSNMEVDYLFFEALIMVKT